jgi:hypothetical protein
MSASDAAPLPRLGEVFFDVRGNSRSMRLSWYADTDVAVFSIWQGGKCTGTFRLPMDDLDRMIEILQRGPEGRSGRRAGERGTGERGYESDRTVVHNAGGHPSAVNPVDYGDGDYGPGDYRSGEYRSAENYEPGDYRSTDRRPAEYERSSRSRSARHRTERYEPGDYGRSDFDEPDYEQDDGWFPDGDNYQADRTGQRFVPEPGYDQQRFAPPYGRSRPDSSEPGFSGDSEYRPPADPAVRSRHSAGRHGGGQAR